MAGIVVGVATFFYPAITAIALFYLVGAWAILRGVFEIIAGIELRNIMSGVWALVLGGIFSITIGLLFVAYPVPGALALAWLIGAYALVFGTSMIALAFLVRGLPGKLEPHAGSI